jgi:mRNA interferase MazF
LFESGDVVVVEFPGAQSVKRRPAVILSSDSYHQSRPDLILGLITAQTAAAIAPSDYVLVDWQEAGLRKPSAYRSFLATVPRDTIIARAGRLSDRDWQAVKARPKEALER